MYVIKLWSQRASMLDRETISIHSAHSATSKDQLLYGSRGKTETPARTAAVAHAPPPKMVPMVSTAPQPNRQPTTDSSTEESRTSRTGSMSSSSGTGRQASIDHPPHPPPPPGTEPVDSATKFLVRRQSQDNFDLTKNVGQIQPDLYMRKGSIVTSGGSKDAGQLLLRLHYDFSKSDFVVTIVETKSLPPSVHEYSFRIFLDPEIDTKARQTSTWKRSQKDLPKEESFKFPLTYEELLDKRLVVKMFESGKLGRIPMISGEVDLELGDLDPSAGVEVWANIEPRKQADIYGELLLSLSYLQSVQRLTVTIHKAKELKKMDISGSSDPYVKAVIIQGGKVVKKRKTSIRKKTLSPVWNEALDFNLPERAIKKSHLELIIMDHDLIGNDEPLGQIVVGAESSDPRAKHLWEDLVPGKSTPPTWLTLHFCHSSQRRNSSE